MATDSVLIDTNVPDEEPEFVKSADAYGYGSMAPQQVAEMIGVDAWRVAELAWGGVVEGTVIPPMVPSTSVLEPADVYTFWRLKLKDGRKLCYFNRESLL